jgi:CubicO group peptidase (beta-lactamase class C family)
MPTRFVVQVLFVIAHFAASAARAQAAAPESDGQVQELVRAARNGDQTRLTELLAEGVDIDGTASSGFTAWMAAKQAGYGQIAELLEAKGARTDISRPSLESLLDATVGKAFSEQTPGCAIVVSRDGQILLEKQYGMARIEPEQPVAADTAFRIGSVSKQFTAMAILKLQEDGKLSVQDALTKYLPDFPRGDQITLHHLLTHTSGMASYTSQPEFMTTVTQATTEDELIASFLDLPPVYEPGEAFDYCNSGYFLLGHIVGKISGSSYEEYLQKEFFEPLKMERTGVHRPDLELAEQAVGYSMVDDVAEPSIDWHMSRAGGAGALYSTAGDLFLWNEALFSGRVVSRESLDAATASTSLRDGGVSAYGYGLMAHSHRGLGTVAHSGGLDGFQSYLVRYPEQQVTIVVLLNAMPAGSLPAPTAIAEIIGEYLLADQMEPREVRVVDPDVDRQSFSDFVGTYDYGSSVLLDVTLEGDQLFAQLTGQARHEIYPKNANTFFWKVVDAEVEFVRDASGKVIKAIHRQKGAVSENKRLEDASLVKLSNEQLDAFVGRYDYGGAVMTVTREGNQLIAQLTGQEPYPIFPTDETTFAWRIAKAEVKFVKDDQGKVVKGIHTQGGRSFDVARMETLETIQLSEEKLDEYVGRYNYGFLSGKMEVTREGQRLMAKLRGQPKLEIVPVGEDEFRWKDVNASITFERDEQGKVVRGKHTQAGKTMTVPRVD